MRILNRPMFKYGGPIKEGIMHGVRSNYAGGQRVMPSSDGSRPGYAGPGIAILPWLWSTGARILGGQAIKKVGQQGVKKVIPKMTQNLNVSTPKNLQGIFDVGSKKIVGDVTKKTAAAPSSWKDLGKNWWSGDPVVKGSKWGWKTLTSPTANTWAQKAAKFAISPSTVIGGVAWYMWPDGKERKTPPPQGIETGVPGGGDPGMFATPKEEPGKTAAELAAEAKAARTAKLEKYLDTMGYDKAKKGALGDALIDASAIVQDATTEAGSLKKADWGKMINKAIQTTSKRLDKPEQIREAVGLMMTKADIEKDMEDPQTRELRRLQIAGAEKALAGKTTAELIQERMLKGDYPSGKNLARLVTLNNPGANIKVIPSTGMKPDEDTIEYITTVITNANDAGKPFPPGVYVIKDRVIQVDETGTVTPIPISALK